MICVDYACERCKHSRDLIDGWNMACDAFPEGLPPKFLDKDVENMPECNNGIGYERKEE